MDAIRSAASSTAWGAPSTSASNTAAASTGKPACTKSSTAPIRRPSSISIAAGTMPAAMTSLTVAAAASTEV
jgi:hypothetical protein